jgi:hypothetical protein
VTAACAPARSRRRTPRPGDRVRVESARAGYGVIRTTPGGEFILWCRHRDGGTAWWLQDTETGRVERWAHVTADNVVQPSPADPDAAPTLL